MVLAAFSSRSTLSPQAGQRWVRPLKLVGTRSPHPLHSCVVEAGCTASPRPANRPKRSSRPAAPAPARSSGGESRPAGGPRAAAPSPAGAPPASGAYSRAGGGPHAWRTWRETLAPCESDGGGDDDALGGDQEDLHPDSNPGLLARRRERVCWHVRAGETGVPPVCLLADRDGLRRACQWAVQPNRQPDRKTAKLGETEHAAIQHGTAAVVRRGAAVIPGAPL
jgi:hypothetical protein